MTLDEARYDRRNRLEKPEFAPGQDNFDDLFSSDDLFGSTAGSSVNSDLDSLFSAGANTSFDANSPFSGVGGGMFGGSGFSNPQTETKKSQEDAFYEGAGKVLKGTYVGLNSLFSSFFSLTSLFWYKYGLRSLKVSIALIITGIILFIFGWRDGIGISIGSCISAAISTIVFMFNVESSRQCTSEYSDSNSRYTVQTSVPETDMFKEDDLSNFNNGGDMFDSDSEYDESSDDDDDDWAEYEDLLDDVGTESISPILSEDDLDRALDSLQDVPVGMYTRQYLFDMFYTALPAISPNFDFVDTLSEDDDEFYEWEEMLRESGEVVSNNEESIPELFKVRKTLFTVILECSRPKGFKSADVLREIVSIYSHRASDVEDKESIYGKFDNVGKSCFMTIFTGRKAMISLKDTESQTKSWILDSNNKIPVIVGVDPDGKIIYCDFMNVESVIITGMPRSGKTWLVLLILMQLCAYNSPRELFIYVLDPKEGISDFRCFKLPHVKKFESSDGNILSTLRGVVKIEAARRKKIIGDHNFVNIWDFKREYPNVDLPIIYIIIDEVVTLASRMNTESFNEYKMLLRELISQLPALGIRAILIPHILNNDIIEKKTSDLVSFRVSVGGDQLHIEKATGSKFKGFPYRLVNKGECAMRLTEVSSKTLFVRSAVLTKEPKDNDKLFNYMARAWMKIDPGCEEGSVALSLKDEQADKKVLDSLNDSENLKEVIDNFFA